MSVEAQPAAAVETRALTRRFGEVAAVDALDLRVAAGTFFGFLGPNGAGKSTTIRMLTGLLAPTSGSATVMGYDLERDPIEVKRRIGVVPDDLALFDRLTGQEQLRFSGRMHGLDAPTIRGRSDELLELLGLAGDRRKLVLEYSHGMRKKLALACALLHAPRVLFLDEPFEGLDAVSARLIKSLLNDLARGGITIFLTSHILEIVERLCHEVAIVDRGRLVARGTLAELRRDAGAGSGSASLEDLFLRLVGGDARAEGRLTWLG